MSNEQNEESSTASSWSDDIELVLRNILNNSNVLSSLHKTNYIQYNARLKYYKIPVIILSAINSVISVGLSQFIKQDAVSVMTCLLSLICGCISSIELFMNINKNQEIELEAYRGFITLSVRISSTIKLERENRDAHGTQFLTTIINEYNRLFGASLVLINDIDDKLINITNIDIPVMNPIKKPSGEIKEDEIELNRNYS